MKLDLKIQQKITVPKKTRLYDTIWRGYNYAYESDVWFYSKKKKSRLKEHANKCFHHAHYIIRKWIKENLDPTLNYSWGIQFKGRVSNSDFYWKFVNFEITITEDQ